MSEERIKNVATTIAFPLIDASTYEPYTTSAWGELTSASIISYSWSDTTSLSAHNITSIPVHAGNGIWQLHLTQTEMNPSSGADDYMIIKFDAYEIESQNILISLVSGSVDSAMITAIKERTDLLPNDPASNSVVYTRLATSAYTVSPTVSEIRTEIDNNSTKLDVSVGSRLSLSASNALISIQNKTDLLPDDPASNSVVYTRLATSGYTSASNEDILAIKAKTDLLSFSGSNLNVRIVDASVLNDITVADILSGVVDSKTVSEILEIVLAFATGRIAVSGNVFTYFKQDNVSVIYTLTGSDTSRTRS